MSFSYSPQTKYFVFPPLLTLTQSEQASLEDDQEFGKGWGGGVVLVYGEKQWGR